MPSKSAPEFYWSEKRKSYRKRFQGPDGRWHDAWGKTKPACRAKVEELKKQLADDYRPPSELTVAEYAASWFALHTTKMKSNTKERYRTNINRHIAPAIGAMRLVDVRYDDIKAMMVQCGSLSRATQSKILTAARKIFDTAVKNELIKNNPCYDIAAEGPPAEKREALTKAQQAQLLEAVAGTGAETFVKLCMYAGLRRGEALGLFWDAVHLDGETPYLSVRRFVEFDNKGQPTVLDYGKSEAATREIPLPPPLLDRLKEVRQESGPVIRNTSGGVMSKQSFRRLWGIVEARTEHEAIVREDGKKIRRMLRVGEKIPQHNVTIMLDFQVTPHMLRHTYVSELILAGVNVKTVQYLAGHASAQITLNIYTHLMENRPQDNVAARLRRFDFFFVTISPLSRTQLWS